MVEMFFVFQLAKESLHKKERLIDLAFLITSFISVYSKVSNTRTGSNKRNGY